MKTKIKIILTVIIIIVGIALINRHQDLEREAYAQNNNCVWTVYGSHDICK